MVYSVFQLTIAPHRFTGHRLLLNIGFTNLNGDWFSINKHSININRKEKTTIVHSACLPAIDQTITNTKPDRSEGDKPHSSSSYCSDGESMYIASRPSRHSDRRNPASNDNI